MVQSLNINIHGAGFAALNTLGPKAKAALPALEELCHAPSPDTRKAARTAIAKISRVQK
jgi:hypothetical protein